MSPLAEMLQLKQRAWAELRISVGKRFGTRPPDRAFVVAIAGSVAVGKSCFAHDLKAALDHVNTSSAAIVSGDNFLHPNAELAARGLMPRKGFPESFNREALAQFGAAVSEGRPEIVTPVYSHEAYDILPDKPCRTARPKFLIFEGVAALQTSPGDARLHDFGIYIEAPEAEIEGWYLERFLSLRHTGTARASEVDLRARAMQVWREINLPNLREHIAPTRALADVVVQKGPGHRVRRLLVRA